MDIGTEKSTSIHPQIIDQVKRETDINTRKLANIAPVLKDEAKDHVIGTTQRYLALIQYAAKDPKFAAELATQLAVSETVQEMQGKIDPLTQVLMRRIFEQKAQLSLADSSSKKGLYFIMMDLDHFKLFNTTHGHDGGDKVLTRTGSLLNSNFNQKNDIVGRYGGEEFCLMISADTDEEVAQRLDTLRKKFETESFVQNGQDIKMPTTSFGFYKLNPLETLESAQIKADTALYVAKGQWVVDGISEEGRNRVIGYDPKFETHTVKS